MKYLQKLMALLAVGVWLTACGGVQTQKATSINRISASLTVQNLSEDMGGLGTINDEIVLLVVNEQQQLRYGAEFVLDSVQQQHSFTIADATLSQQTLLVVMLEVDTEEHLSYFQEKVTTHLPAFKSAALNQDYKNVSALLGDDDVLGIRLLDCSKLTLPQTITFTGMQLFDRYAYTLLLE